MLRCESKGNTTKACPPLTLPNATQQADVDGDGIDCAISVISTTMCGCMSASPVVESAVLEFAAVCSACCMPAAVIDCA